MDLAFIELIFRRSDSIVSGDAVIKPSTVAGLLCTALYLFQIRFCLRVVTELLELFSYGPEVGCTLSVMN